MNLLSGVQLKRLKNAVYGIVLSVLTLMVCLESHPVQAFGRRAWYGPRFRVNAWRAGYWWHGSYLGRAGWWWVVGPTWYFYPAPVYPYPSPDAQPVYYVTAQAAPPPQGSAPPPPPPATPDGSRPPQAVEKATPNAKAFSYYCDKTKSYYPAVTDCPAGWIATPVDPPK